MRAIVGTAVMIAALAGSSPALATRISRSARRRPGAASVGAWSLAEQVRHEAHRWHVGASSTR
jgi:hypothetical protein